jgi:alpha-glucosidase (family GH31 glycosyl hydrolase)
VTRALATFALAAALVAAASAEAVAAVVADAGGLRAEVGERTWRLELADRDGRRVLAQDPATGPEAAGTLGFRTAAGWQHATRVTGSRRRGDAYLADLETTDPGRTIRVRLEPAAGGVIALDARVVGTLDGVEAIGIGFEALAGERYLGFGERSNAAAQDGNVVESYVADGPYQTAEYPLINAIVPRWGLRDDRPEATYYPVPWLLSTAGYGVLVDNPETSYFRLRSERADAWSVEVVPAPAGETGAAGAPPVDRLRLRFFAGPGPAQALKRFTRDTGRQPKPPPWALGTWFQADDDETAEVARLREHDAPVSVLQTYVHYLPCGDQRAAPQAERTAAAHDAGVAITTYFNPMICGDYQPAYGEAAAAGALTAEGSGSPYTYTYGADVDENFFVSQFDFFTDAGRDGYAALLGEAIGDGYDGWMEDFGEYTPLDSVSAGTIHGTRAHNPYAAEYHCAAHDATRDADRAIVRFQRSGWTGAAGCASVVWGGDPTTAWGFDGLRSAVTQALSGGASGIAVWGSDIGGFFAIGANELTPELLIRWVQLGAVSPVMRTQANGVAVPSRDRPQVLDSDQIGNWRRYTKLHTQLYPYLAAAARTYRRRGMPIVRHLALAEPGDPNAAAAEDQFLFGPDLLAAPVLDPGVTQREVYLPRGRWVDLWRSAAFDEVSGGLRLGRAATFAGLRTLTLPAPLTELPLLVRAGATIPMLSPSVDTLAPYGEDHPDLVSLADKRGSLRLLAFPRGRSSARMFGGERLRSIETAAGWRLAIRGDTRRQYRLQASLAALEDRFRPCRLEVDGRELAPRRWSYDRRTRVLNAEFGGRTPKLEVIGRDCR